MVAVLVAAAPVTLVAGVGFAGAWLRGWPPSRLWRAAAWSLPMTAVYLAGKALHASTWQAFALRKGIMLPGRKAWLRHRTRHLRKELGVPVTISSDLLRPPASPARASRRSVATPAPCASGHRACDRPGTMWRRRSWWR